MPVGTLAGSMALWEWAGAGAVFLAAVVFCVRLMKRGLTTLEDERAQCLERIRQMEEKIQEDQKNMASSEHLRIARAGLEDLLHLAGNPVDMQATPVFSIDLCRKSVGCFTVHPLINQVLRVRVWVCQLSGLRNKHASEHSLAVPGYLMTTSILSGRYIPAAYRGGYFNEWKSF